MTPKTPAGSRRLIQRATREEDVIRAILDYAAIVPSILRLWRVAERIPRAGKAGGRLSTPGIPDLIGYINLAPRVVCPTCSHGLRVETAVPLFVECKRPGGRRRPAQIAFIETAKAAGCVAFFAESFEGFEAEIRRARGAI